MAHLRKTYQQVSAIEGESADHVYMLTVIACWDKSMDAAKAVDIFSLAAVLIMAGTHETATYPTASIRTYLRNMTAIWRTAQRLHSSNISTSSSLYGSFSTVQQSAALESGQ